MTTLNALCEGQDVLWLKRFVSAVGVIGHKVMVECQLKQLWCQHRHLNTLCQSYVTQRLSNLDPNTLILIWDTGTSFGLTQLRSDFIDYVKCDISVKDVTKVNGVIGIGTTLHKIVETNGKDVFLSYIL